MEDRRSGLERGGTARYAFTIRLSDSAVFSRVDESSGVVLELTRKRYYMLSETAAVMLQMLREHGALSFAEIVTQLLDRYDVTRVTLEADLVECVADLERRRVVVISGSAGPSSVED